MHVVNEPQDPECGCNEIQKIKTRREKREREREIDGLQSDRQTDREKEVREGEGDKEAEMDSALHIVLTSGASNVPKF